MTTYRFQLGEDLTFADAKALIPCLADLGITDLYLSPTLTAAPGSTHGYDTVDHRRVSTVMGGREQLEVLAAEVDAHGMGAVVDIAPSHMAVPAPNWHNLPLWSVPRERPDSPYVAWFDLSLNEPILMPILGKRTGAVPADGELTLEQMVVPGQRDLGEQWVLCYYDHVFPAAQGTEALPMHVLVECQHYRLTYWKVGDEEINYRRFFDVDTLAAICVEEPDVFAGSYGLISDLMRDGVTNALQVDHLDDLADPGGYLIQLAEATSGARIAAEKILVPDESLPTSWPVVGTTGCDVAWRTDRLQVDPADAARPDALMQELTGDAPVDYDRIVEEAKREVIAGPLAAEVDRLAYILDPLTSQDVRLCDHTLRDLWACVVELFVAADQYRVYVVPGTPPGPETAAVLQAGAERARQHLGPNQGKTLDLMVAILPGEPVGSGGLPESPERTEAIIRFQQVCGAIIAKGVEDTAFYRWIYLTSLTEAGGNPAGLMLSADKVYAWADRIQNARPDTMVTFTTHGVKHGEGVYVRLDALISYAEEWNDLIHRLRVMTAQVRPLDLDRCSENLLWQTLWGIWALESDDPMTPRRLNAYPVKASREQKVWITWTVPDLAWEQALTDYATHLLTSEEVRDELEAFAALTARLVRTAILAGKAPALTWMGASDTYQSSETTRTSLVDPDNRRAADYAGYSGLISALKRFGSGAAPRSLDEDKLFLASRLACLRVACPHTLVGPRSGYRTISVVTSFAFAYICLLDETPDVVVIVRRLSWQLEQPGGWREKSIVLPERTWEHVLRTGTVERGSQSLAEVVRDDAVVVLARVGSPDFQTDSDQATQEREATR